MKLSARQDIRLSADLPDLRETLSSGQIYVCPIRHGSGVKNKLLEAMALGLPIVCYPQAISGIRCVPGKHLLVAGDPQAFARQVLDLLNHPSRAQQLAREALAFVQEQYSWESAARSFERLYREVLGKRRFRRRPRIPSRFWVKLIPRCGIAGELESVGVVAAMQPATLCGR